MKKMLEQDWILYDYIFHKKAGYWHAIKRGNNNWENYINGSKYEGYKMKRIKELIEYITKNK